MPIHETAVLDLASKLAERDVLAEEMKTYYSRHNEFRNLPGIQSSIAGGASFYMPKVDEPELALVVEAFAPNRLYIDFSNLEKNGRNINVTAVFMDYYVKEHFAGLHKQKYFRKDESPISLDRAQFVERFGPPPWEGFDGALATFGMEAYSVSRPTEYGMYEISVRSEAGEFELDQLSSGERIMLSLGTLSLIESTSQNNRLLLLDEVDALLNPTLTPNFIDLLGQIADRHGALICLASHSPTTVALWQSDTIYLMHRQRRPRLEKTVKTNALNFLCADLFSVVSSNTKLVLVEGKDDLEFYSVLVQLAALALLMNQNAISFLAADTIHDPDLGSAGGKPKVRAWLNKLKNLVDAGILRGLCDSDSDGSTHPAMMVTDRAAIENYIFDPVVLIASARMRSRVFAAPVLRDHDVQLEHFSHGDKAEVATRLQPVVDAVTSVIASGLENKYSELIQNKERKTVDLQNGVALMYPAWFLRVPGHALGAAAAKGLGGAITKREDLLNAMRAIQGWLPSELFALMAKVQMRT